MFFRSVGTLESQCFSQRLFCSLRVASLNQSKSTRALFVELSKHFSNIVLKLRAPFLPKVIDEPLQEHEGAMKFDVFSMDGPGGRSLFEVFWLAAMISSTVVAAFCVLANEFCLVRFALLLHDNMSAL